MDYYQSMRNEMIHREMYPTDYRTDFFPKCESPGTLVLKPKTKCVPKFVQCIEGNAVEEGARVFFEGIVDAAPHPTFSWYFNDKIIIPGSQGWEGVEIHDSRKMSTFIIKYVREHHMGKYTLESSNKMGSSISVCDLIVKRKQFPPVFWKRLYDYEAPEGTKLIVEVEVGGWPIPEVSWFFENEQIYSKIHTENYNGFPNNYVPERRVDVIQIDQIHYCLIFSRICESNSGHYKVRAVNGLGEATCEGTFHIFDDGTINHKLYLPEKWRKGKRLNWQMEDMRLKKFVGFSEPQLTEEDISSMTSRISSTPLPKALEYLSSLPRYTPVPLNGLLPMKFKAEKNNTIKTPVFKVIKPTKFKPGKIQHSGYICDNSKKELCLPLWMPSSGKNKKNQKLMKYKAIRLKLPEVKPPPKRAKSPPCPHVWESHEVIEHLYELLNKSTMHENIKQEKKHKKTVEKYKTATSLDETTAKYSTTSSKNSSNKGFNYLKSVKSCNKMSENNEYQEPISILEADVIDNSIKTLKQMQSETNLQTNTFLPVKERAKIIAQQQEDIDRRERQRKEEDNKENKRKNDGTPPGGVRILPSPPATQLTDKQEFTFSKVNENPSQIQSSLLASNDTELIQANLKEEETIKSLTQVNEKFLSSCLTNNSEAQLSFSKIDKDKKQKQHIIDSAEIQRLKIHQCSQSKNSESFITEKTKSTSLCKQSVTAVSSSNFSNTEDINRINLALIQRPTKEFAQNEQYTMTCSEPNYPSQFEFATSQTQITKAECIKNDREDFSSTYTEDKKMYNSMKPPFYKPPICKTARTSASKSGGIQRRKSTRKRITSSSSSSSEL